MTRPTDTLLLARSAVKGANGAVPAVRALLLERVAWAAAKSSETPRVLDQVDDVFESRSPDDEDPE